MPTENRTRRRLPSAVVMGALVAALVLAGCGSSGKKTEEKPPSPQWDATATKTAESVAQEIRAKLPGSCAKLGETNRAEYIDLTQKPMHTELPLYVGACDVAAEEALELSVFADAAKRDAFIKGRTDYLCASAKRRKVDLSGLRWVVADNWSAQFDTEASGRVIADAIGAEYESTACEGLVPDWTETGVAAVEELAAKLKAAELGCRDLTMLNRDELRSRKIYQTRLPAAYGNCTVAADPTVNIAVFDKSSVSRDDWVKVELVEFCKRAYESAAVVGDNWVAFTTRSTTGEKLAKALEGTVQRCPKS